jgi:Phosphomannose isomerase type I
VYRKGKAIRIAKDLGLFLFSEPKRRDKTYNPLFINHSIMSHPTQVFKIVPTIQQYDWGKLGTKSKVAVFAQSAGLADFHVDESKPYAEVSVLDMTPLR